MWRKIVLIGAGGLAESFIYNLAKHNLHPIAIYNRTPERAFSLTEQYSPSTEVVSDLQALPRDAEAYIFAISDKIIGRIAKEMPQTQGIWLHTAATVPLELLQGIHPEAAIFYPLNTFSKGMPVSLSNTPIFVEGSSPMAIELTQSLAHQLGNTVICSTLELRQRMHVAAVFACNFVNHLLEKAKIVMQSKQLPFELLQPLVEETIRKAFFGDPKAMQTGPARRHDESTLEAHRQQIKQFAPELLLLYNLLTESISDLYL